MGDKARSQMSVVRGASFKLDRCLLSVQVCLCTILFGRKRGLGQGFKVPWPLTVAEASRSIWFSLVGEWTWDWYTDREGVGDGGRWRRRGTVEGWDGGRGDYFCFWLTLCVYCTIHYRGRNTTLKEPQLIISGEYVKWYAAVWPLDKYPAVFLHVPYYK